MLFMSGICAILAVLTLTTGLLSRKRRRILAMLEVSAMFLLLADRLAYLYRGDPSTLGYWMVRVSNFLVFFLSLYLAHAFTLYLYDLYSQDAKITPPKRLLICEGLFVAGCVLLVISQFTGLYYTFDETNTYQRSPGHVICYIMPMLIMLLQLSVILQYRRSLNRIIRKALLLNTVIPLVASVLQIFVYGVLLTNMSLVGTVILLYFFALNDLNLTVKQARDRERDRNLPGGRRTGTRDVRADGGSAGGLHRCQGQVYPRPFQPGRGLFPADRPARRENGRGMRNGLFCGPAA